MKSTRHLPQIAAAMVTAAIFFTGCGKPEPKAVQTPAPEATTAALPVNLLLAAPPAGTAQSVAAIKSGTAVGDAVLMNVVVGGRAKPFVNERAVMTVVDAAVENRCVNEAEGCKTPWDYCCAGKEVLAPAMATLQIVDADGKPLALDLNGTAIKPGATMLIAGTVAAKLDGDNLVVNATAIYIE